VLDLLSASAKTLFTDSARGVVFMSPVKRRWLMKRRTHLTPEVNKDRGRHAEALRDGHEQATPYLCLIQYSFFRKP
jgi:hypothetical protein